MLGDLLGRPERQAAGNRPLVNRDGESARAEGARDTDTSASEFPGPYLESFVLKPKKIHERRCFLRNSFSLKKFSRLGTRLPVSALIKGSSLNAKM